MTAHPPNADDLIGRTIAGRYRIVSRLGAGGMGVAYRAWAEGTKVPVVIKVPKRACLDDPTFAERFAREIQLLQGLAHPHVVPIVDVGTHDGLPYVVMRFLPGGSLSNRRLRDDDGTTRPNPPGMLHLWLPAVAEALDHVHANGVIHRDVKPANIFFDAFWNAFLGDFGIAKIVAESGVFDREHTLTATNMGIGTQEYMAPERFAPKPVLDGRTDQYALAVMVYELLSGTRPFTGTTAHLIVEVTTMPVPRLDRQRAGLPVSLVEAVHRGLAKKPQERFGTCREFAAQVLRDVPLLADEPDVARLLCPSCSNILKLPVSAAGRKGKCPKCQTEMKVARDLGALWLVGEERHGGAEDGGDLAQAENSAPADTDHLLSFQPLSDTKRFPSIRRISFSERWPALQPWLVIGGVVLAAAIVGVKMLGPGPPVPLPSKPGGPAVVGAQQPSTLRDISAVNARPAPSADADHDVSAGLAANRVAVEPEPAPTSDVGRDVPPVGTGLLGEYFEGSGLDSTRKKLTRLDPQIQINFKRHPVGHGVPTAHFSVRWSGWLVPEQPGNYRFVGYSDDGIRIFLDGDKILDEWRGRAAGFTSQEVLLEQGQRYPFVVEYFDHGKGNASIFVNWVGDRVRMEPVPTRCLYPAASADEPTAHEWADSSIPDQPRARPPDPLALGSQGDSGMSENRPSPAATLSDDGVLGQPAPPGSVEAANSIGMKFRLIAAGEFQMGDPEGRPTEVPHKVTLTRPFFMGAHEVTNEQWRQVMGDSPSRFSGSENPVEQVAWQDAVKFCEQLSALEGEREAGRVYRLPTSAEWEYACRAGTATRYSFGDDEQQLADHAWFLGNAGDRTHPRGRKKPNSWGLFDMYGNVWEWCSDWRGPYEAADEIDPKGPPSSELSQRVLRGGCYLTSATKHPFHSAARLGLSAWKKAPGIGLRVVFEANAATVQGAGPDVGVSVVAPIATQENPSSGPNVAEALPDDCGPRIERALRWIADHQLPDGGWSFDLTTCPRCAGQCSNSGASKGADRCGATAMALLPFLGRGYSHREGPYEKQIGAGIGFLLSLVREGQGKAYRTGGSLYSQAFAAIVLAECYAMSKDAMLGGPAQAALNFIVEAQDPAGGGWRYSPGQPGDTSSFGWQITALHSGHLAGLKVNPLAVRKAIGFLDSVQVDDGSGYGYTSPREGRGTSAVGLLCRTYLGWTKDNAPLQRGLAKLVAIGPTEDLYYDYYATRLMHSMAGDDWISWIDRMKAMLEESQSVNGHEAGSWFDGVDGGHGAIVAGRLYCTSLATMILEIEARQLLIYRSAGATAAPKRSR